MRNAILIFFLFGSFCASLACECPPTSLSRAEAARYDIIFRGRVLAVSSCEQNLGSAMFEVLELYKGSCGNAFKVVFACDAPCAQKFTEGDEWIIYTHYRHMNDARMDWCSRSRKYFQIESQDFYKVNYGNDYDEELRFLRDSLGLHRISQASAASLSSRNTRPEKWQMVILALVSLAGTILFYWLLRKYIKF